MKKQFEEQIEGVQRSFADGRVYSPLAGIVAASARTGQSLTAGMPIAEILDPADTFVDWHVPNARLVDPKIGDDVAIVFGNWRFYGTVTEILPVSDVYSGGQTLSRERVATQIARVRFKPGTSPPALNSTVQVHMYYSGLTARLASFLSGLFGLKAA